MTLNHNNESTIPEHYQKDGQDLLSHLEHIMPEEEMRGSYRFNIMKYATRAGRKDNIVSEINKIIEYAKRWKKWEEYLQESDVEDVNGTGNTIYVDEYVNTPAIITNAEGKTKFCLKNNRLGTIKILLSLLDDDKNYYAVKNGKYVNAVHSFDGSVVYSQSRTKSFLTKEEIEGLYKISVDSYKDIVIVPEDWEEKYW